MNAMTKVAIKSRKLSLKEAPGSIIVLMMAMAVMKRMGSMRVDSSRRRACTLSRLGISLCSPSSRLVTAIVLIPATIVPSNIPSRRVKDSGMR